MKRLKKFLPILLVLCVLAIAYSGKMYIYESDPALNSEIENIYHDSGTSKKRIAELEDFSKTTAKARAYLSVDQTIPVATWTKVQLDTENYDPGNNFNTTLYRFIAPVSGYYQINAQSHWIATTSGKHIRLYIGVNGTIKIYTLELCNDTSPRSQNVSDIQYLNKDDYVEFFVHNEAEQKLDGESRRIFMSIHLLSKD